MSAKNTRKNTARTVKSAAAAKLTAPVASTPAPAANPAPITPAAAAKLTETLAAAVARHKRAADALAAGVSESTGRPLATAAREKLTARVAELAAAVATAEGNARTLGALPPAETPTAKKSGTPAAQHPRDETGAGFAFSAPRRSGAGIDALGYNEASRGNVLGAVLLKLPDTHAGMTAGELTAVAGPLTRKGAATEDSIRAALSHMMHRGFAVLMSGRYTLTARARALLTAAAE